jgi:site-specific recombinase XerD
MNISTKPITDYLNDYLDWIDVEKGLSSTTQENYARFIRRFFSWLEDNDLDGLKPNELTEDHVWDYRIYLARKADGINGNGLKRSTQQYYLIGLRSLLSFFAARDISSLPPDKINLPKNNEDGEVRNLSGNELKRLLSAPETTKKTGLRDRAILETLYSTGLRISELTALDKKQITSLIENNDTSESLELSITGKGNKTRTVYLSSQATEWLKKYLNTRDDDYKPLFINYRGPKDASRRLSDRSIQKKVKDYAIEAGLPKNTTPHVLRHTFATDLLSKGVDIRVLQEFLGHESITATQIYTHVTSKKLKDIHSEHHTDQS